ncbi:hypothetical protein R75461_01657 [Paraburkholderia nemoris]|uniref:DUF4148 domain-containing protein n=1 Tax=Paraburkholderia nemoris TaxID=2793076 RepID=A0ABN7KRW0_9BURK|nr:MULTISPECIES: hypothetical protein [Paraburkholderia]MBK3781186.1 hypothetical protein [Paraburkholderia aspalathi]MBK3809077.1 hypothetical protein [Paraburkholderia aspalathi]CAE6709063.1 hypothetical protein R69776_01014 [Paraburkholderia nemoris]CAE6714352.1 hypothetical protein LMG22931_01436 [Paraburkholderia nemoris]CAE6723932.1 hypothetical protein R75461_01657 [Paraburkholderia nemoris]
MKIARLMLALGLAFAASAGATSTAMAANATYPPAPLPAYAQDELQKVIDAATGPLPVAQTSSAESQSAATPQSPTVLPNGSYATPRVTPHDDESHAAASASKRGARPSKAHRHERHKYV